MADISESSINASILVLQAQNNPEVAAEILRIAATHLKSGTPMPRPLAEHLANAFEIAMAKHDKENRVRMLIRELYLQIGNRPRKSDIFTVGLEFEEAQKATPTMSKTAISKIVAAKFKRKQGYSVSPSHVLKLWKEYSEHIAYCHNASVE